MSLCVSVVSDWDRHGTPAGNWAQASESHLELETDVWLQAVVSEAQPESGLAADLYFFLRLF